MSERPRVELVPEGSVECFEVRIALYFDEEGDSTVRTVVSTPDEGEVWPPLHEVLGVLGMAVDIMNDHYERNL